jgi:hypothetical protein
MLLTALVEHATLYPQIFVMDENVKLCQAQQRITEKCKMSQKGFITEVFRKNVSITIF